jgi:hypothetical protein
MEDNILRLTVAPSLLPAFFPLLAKGFRAPSARGVSLFQFLREALKIEEAYIMRRVQTVFLDGKPVDDLRKAVVSEGSTVALSAAMPGLAGAVLRSRSPFAPMRSRPSASRAENGGADRTCRVRVKLFNLTVREIGPELLKNGVSVDGKDLAELFKDRSHRFQKELKDAAWRGRPITAQDLPHIGFPEAEVLLFVTT